MSRVVTIGECLIDLVPENGEYVAKAGGAPANVCACLSKLGADAYYLGKLGQDEYSDILYNALISANVNTDLVVRDGRYKTAVAKVTLDKNGDRKFSFSRVNTADLMLYDNEIADNLLKSGDILHFCSVCLVEAPVKYAHIKAIKQAKRNGALISFDVNLRNALFGDDVLLKKTVREFLEYADIVKVTDEELAFISGTNDEFLGVKDIISISPASVVLVTKGSNGAGVYDRNLSAISEGVYDVKVVDTTGAGDAFIGSFLYKVLTEGLKDNASDYTDYLDFSTRASSVVVQRYGAIASMPTKEEVFKIK